MHNFLVFGKDKVTAIFFNYLLLRTLINNNNSDGMGFEALAVETSF